VAGELAEAAVEIIADIDDFDDDLRRRLQESAREAADDVERELHRVNEAARQAGESLGREIPEGAEEARRSVAQIGRVAEQAQAAMEDLDPDKLDQIAEEARQASNELGELARQARDAEGEFRDLDPEQLRRIAREAEKAADEMDDIERAAQRVAREIERMTDPEEMERLAREAERAQRQLDRLGRTRFQNVRNEAQQAGRAIFRAFAGNSEAARRELERIDNTRFREVVRRAQEAARGIRRAFRNLGDNDRFGDSLERTARGFRRLLIAAGAVIALTHALAGLSNVIGGLIAVLAPSLGLLAGIPAAALLAGAAFATLKVALGGLKDAFKAALTDPDKLDEALKDLAPSAQKVVKEVGALRPALLNLRKSVQGALFKPLVGQVKAVAANLLGPLRQGMTGTAAQFGRLARGVTDFGKSAEAVSLVKGVFGQLRKQLAGIRTGTITNLLGSVSRFVRATLPGFDGLGSALDGLLVRLTRFLDRSAKSGKALQWLQAGKAQAAALGHLLADLGRIVIGVGRAMQTASDGALGSISTLADGLGKFAQSAEGQAQLVEVFRALNALAAQTLPVITALISGLATLSPIVARLAAELGPALVSTIQALVPALAGIGEGLVPLFAGIRKGLDRIDESGALGQLGRAFGRLLAAVAPLGPAIADVLVSAMRSLAAAANVLAPVLGVVAKALAAIASSPVGALLGPLLAQFLLVGVVTGKWGTALKSLVPILKLVGKAALFLGRALIGLIVANPVVAIIVGVVAALGFLLTRFQAVRDAIGRFRDALVNGFDRLKDFGAGLLETFKTDGPVAALRQLGSAILSTLSGAVSTASRLLPRLLDGLLRGIAAAIGLVPRLLSQLGQAIIAGLRRVREVVPRVARELVTALRDGFAALREQAPVIAASLREAVSQAVAVLRRDAPLIRAQVSELFRSAFAALVREGPGLARQAGAAIDTVNRTILQLAARGIRAAGDLIVANLPGIASRIASVLSSLITRAGEVIPQVLDKLTARIRGGLDQAVNSAAAGGGAGGAGGGGGRLQQTLVDLLVDVGVAFAQQIPRLTPVILDAFRQIGNAVILAALQAMPGIVAAINRLLLAAAQAVLGQIASFLLTLPARLAGPLGALNVRLTVAGRNAMAGLLRGLISGTASVISYLAGLPARLAGALAGLGGQLAARALSAMASFRGRLVSGGSGSQAYMSTLPARLAGALAGLAGQLASRAVAAMGRFRSALASGGGGAAAAARGVGSRVVGALSGLAGQMASVGAAVMQGFISGVRSYAGAVAQAVIGPIQSAISKARSILSIGSPSKVFRDIGRFVVLGFVQGIVGHGKAAQAAVISLARKIIAIGEGLKVGFLKSLTGTSAQIDSAFKNLERKILSTFRGLRTNVDDRLVKNLRTQNAKLSALAKQRDKIAETIKAANEKAAEVTQAARQFASLTGAAGALGEDQPLTSDALEAQLRKRLADLRRFQSDLAALAKRGLNKDLLGQLIAAGPEQGGQLAAAIAKGTNTTIAELNATSKEIAATAGQLGKDSSDLLFDAGKQAGKGFLAGLKAQQKEIVKLMTELAEQVARTVKKTLKIRSPSRVMHGLGLDTLQGFLDGLDALAPQIGRALEEAVRVRDVRLPDVDASQVESVLQQLTALSRAAADRQLAALTTPTRPADAAARARELADRAAARAPQVIKQTEVNAPVTVNMPVADPDAVGQAVSAQIAAKAAR
jgi:hypothetical protein